MAAPADPGFRHPLPESLGAIIAADAELEARWDALTDLARNEWICWTISAKQEATREKRRQQLAEQVRAGDKRPCC